MTEMDLVQRLERLERDSRRMKAFALATVIAALALSGIAATQPIPERIKAHEIDVIDASGKLRVKMAVDYGKYQSGAQPIFRAPRKPSVWRFTRSAGCSASQTFAFTICGTPLRRGFASAGRNWT